MPDEAVFGPVPGRLTPHVYRDEEIVELLAAARQTRAGGLRRAVMETLFGLIACTGLRISEALGCSMPTWTEGRRADDPQSKFGKSRLVPLHPSAVAALRATARSARHVPAARRRRSSSPAADAVWDSPLGDRQVHRIFEELRRQLGWVDRGSHGTPRIHDLRHSFAVRRLVLWHEQGVDMDQRMLALSTYLGHVKVSSTYWYLTGVPELMGVLGQRFERFADPREDGDELSPTTPEPRRASLRWCSRSSPSTSRSSAR